jgi:hypothetical protein
VHERVRYEERGPAVSVEAKKVRARKMVRELRGLRYQVTLVSPLSERPTVKTDTTRKSSLALRMGKSFLFMLEGTVQDLSKETSVSCPAVANAARQESAQSLVLRLQNPRLERARRREHLQR